LCRARAKARGERGAELGQLVFPGARRVLRERGGGGKGEELPRLLDPIVDGADFVQGSRFLAGGRTGGMPLYRHVATRLHPLLFSLTAGKRVSESTNGFRAFRTKLLDDARINLDQSWMDEYELEQYLYWKTIKL